MADTKAVASELIDEARVRVTRYDFAPGAQTGWHRHEFDYVIVAITDCTMRIEGRDGSHFEARVGAGDAYRRNHGVEHNVTNGGESPMSFVEVELK